MKFFLTILSVSGLLLIGRMLGFVREWLIALKVGANSSTDMAIVLIGLPDLMVGLLIGGGFSAAVIPELKRLESTRAFGFFSQVLFIIVCVFFIIAIILSIFSEQAIFLMAPGLPKHIISNNTWVFTIITLTIPLTACAGVLKAKLDSNEFFIYGASGTILFNSFIVISIFFSSKTTFLHAIAIGAVCGALARVIFMTSGLYKIWLPPDNSENFITPAFLKRLLTSVGFAGLLVLLPVLSKSLASLNDEGTLSLFSYAFRVTELPTTLVIGALSTVLLPRLVNETSSDMPTSRSTIVTTLRFSILFSLAIAIPVMFFAEDFMRFLFSSTQLKDRQIEIVSLMLVVSFTFLPGRSVLLLCIPIFSALQLTRFLIFAGAIILGSLIALHVLLTPIWGGIGVMISFSAANAFGAVFLMGVLISHFGALFLYSVFARFTMVFILPCILSATVCGVGYVVTPGVFAAFCTSALALLIFGVVLIYSDESSKQFWRAVKQKVRPQ